MVPSIQVDPDKEMRGLCKEAPVENNLFGYVLKTLHEEGRKEMRAIYRKEQPLYVASAQALAPGREFPSTSPLAEVPA